MVNGSTVFEPANVDEAMDIMDRFGTNVKFSEQSRDTINASA